MSTPRLAQLVPAPWREPLRDVLASEGLAQLDVFVAAERASAKVFPPEAQTFAALEHVAPADVKAVVLGQDPYPTEGNANGLAFSVSPGMKVPASLRNLFAGLELDLGHPAPRSGDLTAWARQGVLLLNTVLTVREGEASSHRKKGWEGFTEAILREVNRRPGPIVFLALGKPAQAMCEALVDSSKHPVVAMPHPSPLNGKAFVTAAQEQRPFTRVNALLRQGGRAPIDWKLA